MFKNYFKIAVRNIIRHKGYSLINICGLAVGMAVCILILLWIQYELSYDRFHEHGDQICRIIAEYKGERIPATPGPMAALLKEEIPEISNSTRFYSTAGVMKYGDKKFRETGLMVEHDFFEVFTFPLIKGDPNTALTDISSLVITDEMAKKYFGDEDPIGKTLLEDNSYPLKVTGVLKNIPNNSHLKFDYLSPFKICKFWKKPDSWTSSQDYPAYVLLTKGSSIEKMNQKINAAVKKHIPQWPARYFLQPLSQIHLYSDFKFDEGRGNIQYILIFTLIALFILIIACINFMNLSTARSAKRAREVGIRKVAGANRAQLLKQFLGESLLLTFIAAIFAIFLVELFLPTFNHLSGKQLSVEYFDLKLILGLLSIVIFASLLSGSYPALFLSAYKPMKVLKGTINTGPKGTLFRKVLVIFQFSLSVIVIVGTMVVFNQLDYVRNKELGFNKEGLIYLPTARENNKNYKVLEQELLKDSNIVNMTASSCLPTFAPHNTDVDWEGKKQGEIVMFQTSIVNHSYLETYKMKMVQGRFYSKEFSTDESDAFVVNEAAVRVMGMQNPIGKRFNAWGRKGRIIGVVKDFHFKSLHNKIEPLILLLGNEFYYFTVRIKTANIPKTIQLIEKVWNKHCPGFPFEYGFLEETIARMYSAEQRLGKIFIYFSFLAIFISCLGLFGLSSFMSEQRTKEIGVRKVVGASVFSIVQLLTLKFTKWVVFANIIGWPIAYFVMDQWLRNFYYRTDIGIYEFILPGLLVLIIALVTVSYQSIRAALANPVEALRYE